MKHALLISVVLFAFIMGFLAWVSNDVSKRAAVVKNDNQRAVRACLDWRADAERNEREAEKARASLQACMGLADAQAKTLQACQVICGLQVDP